MTKRRKAHDRKKQKQLARRRRLDKKQKRDSAPFVRQVTPKLTDKIDQIYQLIDQGSFDEAEQWLDRLDTTNPRCPAILEAQLCLHQTTKDHEACCLTASRLAKLTPRAPDARLIYAQESLYCGRFGIALTNYRFFLEHWPDHANARKAKNAIELVEREYTAKCQAMGFAGADLELLIKHDEALECMQTGQYEDTAEKFLELLQRAPDCMPARNNLALVYFLAGYVEKAVHVAEETCRLAPGNRFAEATLGKLRFLGGNEDEANAIADRIVVNPPTKHDPLGAAIELLSFLGRDEDIVVLSEAAQDPGTSAPRFQAILQHHLAVAQFRLGDERAARRSWRKCLQAMPSHTDARANLADLDSGQGHAPWAESISKWIPQPISRIILGSSSVAGKTKDLDLTKDFPAIAALIPALLDRGDPVGRELAMTLAAADGSPPMLDALRQFALGSRGPDAMRHKALSTLSEMGRLESGTHRFYCNGKWTNIKTVLTKISWEPTPCANPRVRKSIEIGTGALSNGNFGLAEQSFKQALDIEPDNPGAAYNLCIVWLERDGNAGRRRAQIGLEEIYSRFPDYLFAPITLAQFAAIDGDLDRAHDLLRPILEATELQASEAIALYTAQVQIAVKSHNLDAAENSLELLSQIAGSDDPKIARLRRLIDSAARPQAARK